MQIRAFDPKDPSEVDSFEIDLSDRIPATDSIATLVSVTVEDSLDAALVIDRTAFLGKAVSGWWQGGTLDVTYTITARVITVQGREFDKSGTVTIAQT